MGHELVLRGTMKGHTDRVTAIATPASGWTSYTFVTSSRDKSIIVWSLAKEEEGTTRQRLTGHSDSVNDVSLSGDGNFAISASSDHELRLWDLETGTTRHRFVGHTGEILSAAFSPDSRQIMSASCDGSIKLWNTIGECKNTIENAHADQVSCLRFSPSPENSRNPTVVSGSFDRTVKFWNVRNSSCKCAHTGTNYEGRVSALAVSPDGSMCVSGGEGGVVVMWDLEGCDLGVSWDVGSTRVHALCFCPNRYWICAATDDCLRIYDLVEREIVWSSDGEKEEGSYCCSLGWSFDGSTLFGGYTDGTVKVWEVLAGYGVKPGSRKR